MTHNKKNREGKYVTCRDVSSGYCVASSLTRSCSILTSVVYLLLRVSRSRAMSSTVETNSRRGFFTEASKDGQISSNCSLNARSLCP